MSQHYTEIIESRAGDVLKALDAFDASPLGKAFRKWHADSLASRDEVIEASQLTDIGTLAMQQQAIGEKVAFRLFMEFFDTARTTANTAVQTTE